MIPTPTTYPTTYVVNNKDSSDPGEHWVALYIKNKNLIYYFDSLALKPNPCLSLYLKKFEKIVKNVLPIQNIFSDTCAHHCIFFIIHMSRVNSFHAIVDYLEHNPDTDSYVRYFVNKMI